jgi:hypothetical protein
MGNRLKRYYSTYIRVGEKSLLNKVGFYCSNRDFYYDLDQKPDTKNEIAIWWKLLSRHLWKSIRRV